MPTLVTESIFINSLIFVAGLYILTKSSDKFVDGAVFIARRFNISEMVIGLTLVSIGTSLPELATNVCSSLMGKAGVGIAIGNVAGSNICNILVGLALTVIILKKVDIQPKIFQRDILTMLGTFALFGYFCYSGLGDSSFTRLESGIIFMIFIGYTWYLIKHVPKDKMEALEQEMGEDEEDEEDENSFFAIHTLLGALIWVTVSIGFIILGAQMMLQNIVWGAQQFNVPPSIISATIIAIGTSLPEIAVSLSGVKKGKPDIAIGNVIGSCIFNLALVMGVSGLLKAVPIDHETKVFLLPAMLLTGLFTALFMRSNWCLRRWEGILLILAYLTFIGINLYKVL